MTRDEMIDSVISIFDETIEEFENLSKSVSESSGGGAKLTAGGLKGASAAKLKMQNAGSDLQQAESTEEGLSTTKVGEKVEGYETRGYKETGVNSAAFQKADEEEEDEVEKKEEKEEEKEEEVEKKEEKEEEEEDEEDEEKKKKSKKAVKKEVELPSFFKKSAEEVESLVKSISAMQEQINSLSQAVKELSETPVESKGIAYNSVKPLKKSAEVEMLSKSEVVNKLFELQKSGKDVSTDEIVMAELGSVEMANAIAKKYL
jgi:flagellar biosynthesis GTPase FlhF